MSSDELDAIHGNIQALTMTLAAVIGSLPPESAAAVASVLVKTTKSALQSDQEDGAAKLPRRYIQARNDTLDGCMAILQARAELR